MSKEENNRETSKKALIGEIFELEQITQTTDDAKKWIIDLLESITDAYYTLDKHWKITYISKELEKMLGRSHEELVGKCIWEEYPQLAGGTAFKEFHKAVNTNVPVKFETYSAVLNNYYEYHVYPTKVGLSVYCRDITEKKKTEKELARLDCLSVVGQVASGIAHEIRNPMTSVKGFIQLLADAETDVKKLEYYSIMIDELHRANLIITESLFLAKDRMVNLQPASLNSIINKLYSSLSSDAVRENKRIVLNQGDLPNISLNEKEITQLLINLVKNGLASMSSGGVLTIGTYVDKTEVVLYVEDEGGGISPEFLDKLGIPFITGKDGGTGLGLAVCYSIVEKHKAKLDVKTGSSGTTFYMRFKIPDNDNL